MNIRDFILLTLGAVRGHPLRTVLTMLGIAIGTASVILLTSIGEGIRVYVNTQFSQFGTNILSIMPGKTTTFGLPGIATTVRKLTIADALALQHLTGVKHVVPISFGTASVEWENRSRSVFIDGVTSDVPEVYKLKVRQGLFLPPSDPRRGSPLTVLGPKLKHALFGEKNPLGKYLRIGGVRHRVIGVMEPKGQLIGIDMDDLAFIPVSQALRLFNRDGLQNIDINFARADQVESVTKEIKRILIKRHDGEEDFTIITQTGMLRTLDKIIRVMTAVVAAIAAISLLVGAVGIITMMWISVNERIEEIGLQKAIGATPRQILILFLGEAALLSTLGGAMGVIIGLGIAHLIGWLVPALPVFIPYVYVALSLMVSLVTGLASGALPARRAAQLDPLDALRAE
jgi:putative ABC transport system permease protein